MATSKKILDDKLHHMILSSITVKELLEKECSDEAKMKRDLYSAKRYKALAWEQLAVYEMVHRTNAAEENRLLKTLNDKAKVIASLRKTFFQKKQMAIGYMVSSAKCDDGKNSEDGNFDHLYKIKEDHFNYIVNHFPESTENTEEEKEEKDQKLIPMLEIMLRDPDFRTKKGKKSMLLLLFCTFIFIQVLSIKLQFDR